MSYVDEIYELVVTKNPAQPDSKKRVRRDRNGTGGF